MNELVRLTTQDVSKAIPVTDTFVISEFLELNHKSVIQLARKYEGDLAEFGGVTFEMLPFETNGGVQNREVMILNESQSTLLITYMKNTEKVRDFKKKLIKNFYLMKNELQARQETRHIGIAIRKDLTETIKNKVSDGGNFKKFAYGNYSKLVYKKVLGTTVKKAKEDRGLKESDNIRNFLTMQELEQVQALESKIAFYIEMRTDISQNDKEVYAEVKDYIEKICKM